MWRRPHELARVGALPVLEGQRLVGIITERDITAALAEGADPVTTRVGSS